MKVNSLKQIIPQNTSHPGIQKKVFLNEGDIEGLKELSYAEIVSGKTVDMHGHNKYAETFFILEGNGEVEFGDGTKILVEKGMAIGTNPDETHQIKNLGGNVLKFLVIKTPQV